MSDNDAGVPATGGVKSNRQAIAFLGFGEAAQAFARGFARAVPAVSAAAYDIKTDVEGPERDAKQADYAAAGVRGCATLAAAFDGAGAIFSLVTADQALAAARAAAATLQTGVLYFDCNSCAPQTKQAAAEIIEAAGGRYVDAAVMAPVHPLLHRSPVLVSGPHTVAALALMSALDMDARDAGGDVGRASSIKLVRSIMMKGLEGLAVECLLAGRRLGVDDVVLASLEQTYPGFGWDRRLGLMLERVMVHGLRRSAEMAEAAKMVSALGLPSQMVEATTEVQRQVGALGLRQHSSVLETGSRQARADAIIEAWMGLVRESEPERAGH